MANIPSLIYPAHTVQQASLKLAGEIKTFAIFRSAVCHL